MGINNSEQSVLKAPRLCFSQFMLELLLLLLFVVRIIPRRYPFSYWNIGTGIDFTFISPSNFAPLFER